MLLLACHFHDAGMAGTDWHNQTPDGRALARKEHANSIGDRLRNEWLNLGFRDQRTAEVLGEVCKGHRPRRIDGVATWDDYASSVILGPGRKVRLRLLCALIYAADELHLGHDRAPLLEQDWLRIQDMESRKHWRRHSAIFGPEIENGKLCFDITIQCGVLEKDIRQEVLTKAFKAVQALKAQLAAEAIPDAIPEMKVRWTRDDFWRLLVIDVAADRIPRLPKELEDLVFQRFSEQMVQFVPLNGLCIEEPGSDDLIRSRIHRVIEEFRVSEWLIPSEDSVTHIRMAADSRVWNKMVAITRVADTLGNQFGTALDAQHEFRFYTSVAGTAYVNDSLLHKVKDVFGVNLSSEPEDSGFLTVLRKSPTAQQMIETMRSNPGVFVSRYSLAMTLLAGMSSDLQQDPTLLLDRDLRHAIKKLSGTTGNLDERFYPFIEECALLLGLSHEQLGRLVLTEEDHSVIRDEDPKSHESNLSFQQTTPQKQRVLDFGLLFVAHKRSGYPVEILNVPFAKLEVTHNLDAPDGEIASLAFSEAPRTLPGRYCLRAILVVDPESRSATFRSHVLTNLRDDAPFVVTLSPPGKDLAGQFSFRPHPPCCTVGTLRLLQQFNELIKTGPASLTLELDDGRRIASCQIPQGGLPAFNFAQLIPDFMDELLDVPDSSPMPWFFATPTEDHMEPVDVHSLEHGSPNQSTRLEVTSVTLRVANANNVDFQERFLTFLEPGIHFTCPAGSASKDGTSKEELQRLWDEGNNAWIMTGLWEVGMTELANELRSWSQSPSKQFPLNFSTDPLIGHGFKTFVEMRFEPKIDRGSYFERPVLIKLRPPSNLEQKEVELTYWTSQGDLARAELTEEIIARLKKRATSKSSEGLPAKPDSDRSPESTAPANRTADVVKEKKSRAKRTSENKGKSDGAPGAAQSQPQSKLAWPKNREEQLMLIQQHLQTAKKAVRPLEISAQYYRLQSRTVAKLLDVLVAEGLAKRSRSGGYISMQGGTG